MSITDGADADALDRLAGHIEQGASRIEGTFSPVRQSFHGSSWQGADADQFAGEWDGPSKSRLVASASALRDAAKTLRRNAHEQRVASDSQGGSTVASSTKSSRSKDAGDSLTDISSFLDKLGLARSARDLLLKTLRSLDPDATKAFGQFLARNPLALDLFKGLDKVVDVGGALLNFATDWSTHPGLPIDEHILHAAAFMGIKFGEGSAFKWVTSKIGGLVGSAVLPPLGTVVGGVAGFGAGLAMSEGMKYADGEWNVSEKGADAALDGYREAKHASNAAGRQVGHVTHDVSNWTGNSMKFVRGNNPFK